MSVLEVGPLGFPWKTVDPFLFCVHHDDRYPKGDDQMGPVASLDGRNLGQDFAGVDGWNMYHGHAVPGFPQHPHRGFETITLARHGFVDHSDSLGATARFGQGDVQWMTAGKGIVHAEMFPLVKRDVDNPLELFQIWINLPAVDKMVDPYFTMIWNEQIPTITHVDLAGRTTLLRVVAGRVGEKVGATPPPNSWASRSEADIGIYTIRMEPEAAFSLPAAKPGTNRTLYFFEGREIQIGDRKITGPAAVRVRADVELALQNGHEGAELLVLQGRPIGEPVAHYGPFVMNTQAELQQAFDDYRRTRFGGWPWPSDDPVHDRERDRFAKHADGRIEKPA